METIEVAVIGAGHAGAATSHELSVRRKRKSSPLLGVGEDAARTAERSRPALRTPAA